MLATRTNSALSSLFSTSFLEIYRQISGENLLLTRFRSKQIACDYEANLLLPLNIFPYLKKRYGNGIIAKVKKASNEVAHW